MFFFSCPCGNVTAHSGRFKKQHHTEKNRLNRFALHVSCCKLMLPFSRRVISAVLTWKKKKTFRGQPPHTRLRYREQWLPLPALALSDLHNNVSPSALHMDFTTSHSITMAVKTLCGSLRLCNLQMCQQGNLKLAFFIIIRFVIWCMHYHVGPADILNFMLQEFVTNATKNLHHPSWCL